MEFLIKEVCKAFVLGNMTINDMHDAIIKEGWSEDDAFLAIKAGELLYKTIKKADLEKKKPSFKRST